MQNGGFVYIYDGLYVHTYVIELFFVALETWEEISKVTNIGNKVLAQNI